MTDPSAPTAKSTRPHRVLICDDDPGIVTSLSKLLQKEGIEVLIARDGNVGLAMAETDEPDVLILDMMMPKRSGLLVLEKLVERTDRTMRIIMITGNEGKRHEEYARQLGVDAYFQKVFDEEQLIATVKQLLPARSE